MEGEVIKNQFSMLKRLIPFTQHYAWGDLSRDCAVARLAEGNGNDLRDIPYAELWMGAHKNGMNQVVTPDGPVPLDVFIESHPEFREAQGPNELPFLFKVLSCGRPLSLQSHPSLEDARRLHAEQPDVYRDPNHKPEMTVALSEEFEALCGFYPRHVVEKFATSFPSLQAFVDPTPLNDREFYLRAFSKLLQVKDTSEGARLLHTVKSEAVGYSQIELLFRRVLSYFPDDPTAIAVFLLQYHLMKKGEAIFVGPNLIHAYLKGDCVECMACSDNVIRGGLTPKFIDKENLIKLLNFQAGGEEPVVPRQVSAGHIIYDSPVPEFEIHRMTTTLYTLPTPSPMVLVCVEGQGDVVCSGQTLKLEVGTVVLVARGAEIEMRGDAVVFGAHSRR